MTPEPIGISSQGIDTFEEEITALQQEEITALQQELEASGLVQFKELTRIRQELADQELKKAREEALRFRPARKQPPTGRTPVYMPTPIGPRTSTITKPWVNSVLRLALGALRQLQGAL